MELMVKVEEVAGKLILKPPEASVMVPTFVPLAVTLAPTRGTPLSSVTVPVIVFVWENTVCVKSTQMRRQVAALISNR